MKNPRYITKEQQKELESLAYWIADLNYIKERHGKDDPELEKCRKTIDFIFSRLDELKTPFSIQNNVICFFEEWRNYKEIYFSTFLKDNNIIVK